MTNDEILALCVAMDKRLKEVMSEVKQDARDNLIRLNETTGADRKPIKVRGIKVGNVSMREGHEKVEMVPGMESEAIAYLESKGLTETVPKKGWEDSLSMSDGTVFDPETGEELPFMRTVRTPDSAQVTGCKPDDVVSAFGDYLRDEDIYGVLGGMRWRSRQLQRP